jgi:hypothetical protein
MDIDLDHEIWKQDNSPEEATTTNDDEFKEQIDHGVKRTLLYEECTREDMEEANSGCGSAADGSTISEDASEFIFSQEDENSDSSTQNQSGEGGSELIPYISSDDEKNEVN